LKNTQFDVEQAVEEINLTKKHIGSSS